MKNKLKNMINKINRLFEYPEIQRFQKIRAITNGYLAAAIYKAIYQCACQAEEGYMIDIGPAQGGSSISLGLGIKKSGKQQSKVISIEKGSGSDALADKKNVDKNLSILEENIAKFSLSNYSIILMGDVAEVYKSVKEDLPLSLLFIDADGALDRDFKLFYNRLRKNAPIIIDDYANIINSLARENYLLWKTHDELNSYVSHKGKEHLYEVCPLGKEYTTYRFINYFLDQGLLKLDRVMDQTFFGHKSNDNVYFTEEHESGLLNIRLEIEKEYYEMNPNLTKL